MLQVTQSYGPYGAVGVKLRLIWVCVEWVVAAGKKHICYGAFVARLISVCPDGTKCDICKNYQNTVILNLSVLG